MINNIPPAPVVPTPDEPAESKLVKILGLPLFANEDYVSDIIGDNGVAVRSHDGRQQITVRGPLPNKFHKMAIVKFTEIEFAKSFKIKWNQQCPPNSEYRMKIEYMLDRDEQKILQLENVCVVVKHLPLEADVTYILFNLVEDTKVVAKDADGKPMINIRRVQPNDAYKMARITFTSIDNSKYFRDKWNQKLSPGTTYKLDVTYWHDTIKDETKVSRRRSNSVIIHGLPENVTVPQLCSFIGNVACKAPNEPLVFLFPEKKGCRSARAILPYEPDATEFIKNNNNKPFPGCFNNLTIDYYTPKDKSSDIDKETSLKIRSRTADSSRTVIIKGLPKRCDEKQLLSLAGDESVEIGDNGHRSVTILSRTNSATISFKTVAQAQEFIEKYDNNCLPGEKNKLKVHFYLDLAEPLPVANTQEESADHPKTVVKNVLFVKGIPKTITKSMLETIIENQLGKKPKATIYRYQRDNSDDGTICFNEASDAERCLTTLKEVKHNDFIFTLTFTRYETLTSTITRLVGSGSKPEEISIESAYECLICSEIWDEREMTGCVPSGREGAIKLHFFCQICATSKCETSAPDGKEDSCLCLVDSCKRVILFPPSIKRALSNAQQFDKRSPRKDVTQRAIESIERCKNCGHSVCMDGDPQDKQFFSCPSCRTQYCRNCKISYSKHNGLSCVEVKRQGKNMFDSDDSDDDSPMELKGFLDVHVEGTDGNSSRKQSQVAIWKKQQKKIYLNFLKGLCLIISNQKFEPQTKMDERFGTEKDCKNISDLFEKIGYHVHIKTDLTGAEMWNVLRHLATAKKNGDSVVVVVLTHGEKNVLFGIDGEKVYVPDLLAKFNGHNAPGLRGKPKLFFFQACRGKKYDSGVSSVNHTDSHNSFACIKNFIEEDRIPAESDFLIAYSTVGGYVSWRHPDHGSWFIQAVVEVFSKYAWKKHIGDMMTVVQQRIADGKETGRDGYKQIPEFVNRLRKNFYFFPGIDSPP